MIASASPRPNQRTSSNSWSWLAGRRPSAPSGSSARSCGSGVPACTKKYWIGPTGCEDADLQPGLLLHLAQCRLLRASRRASGVPLGSDQVTPSRSRRRLPEDELRSLSRCDGSRFRRPRWHDAVGRLGRDVFLSRATGTSRTAWFRAPALREVASSGHPGNRTTAPERRAWRGSMPAAGRPRRPDGAPSAAAGVPRRAAAESAATGCGTRGGDPVGAPAMTAGGQHEAGPGAGRADGCDAVLHDFAWYRFGAPLQGRSARCRRRLPSCAAACAQRSPQRRQCALQLAAPARRTGSAQLGECHSRRAAAA